MNEMEQTLSKFVGHHAEGALRFRNGIAVGTEAPDFELRSRVYVCHRHCNPHPDLQTKLLDDSSVITTL